MQNITGRDNYLITQALVEWIAREEKKPANRRRLSNENDMRAILASMAPDLDAELAEITAAFERDHLNPAKLAEAEASMEKHLEKIESDLEAFLADHAA